MSDTPNGLSRNTSKNSLKAESHRQVMELLQHAEASNYPDIRKAAIDLAKQREKHQQNLESKLSPRQVAVLASTAVVLSVAACWIAIVRYPQHVALEITGCIVGSLIIVLGLYTLMSGHLSQANFMRMVRFGAGFFKQPES